MFSSKLIMAIIVAILYIAASTALPTRTSTTDTSTRDSSSDVSGSGSSSGDDCDAELSRRQVDNLVSKIETSIDDLYEILEDVHVWTHEVFTVNCVLVQWIISFIYCREPLLVCIPASFQTVAVLH